jgi:hypothetical protein
LAEAEVCWAALGKLAAWAKWLAGLRWLGGWVAGWLGGRLAGWLMAGTLAGQLVGWLVTESRDLLYY